MAAGSELPFLTFEVDLGHTDVDVASRKLDEFAARFGVAPTARARLRALLADTLAAVTDTITGPERGTLRVEADLDEVELQVALTLDVADPPEQLSRLDGRLAPVGARADRFETRRVGTFGIEIWSAVRVDGATG